MLNGSMHVLMLKFSKSHYEGVLGRFLVKKENIHNWSIFSIAEVYYIPPLISTGKQYNKLVLWPSDLADNTIVNFESLCVCV